MNISDLDIPDLKDAIMALERSLRSTAQGIARDVNLHRKGKRQILADSVKLRVETGTTHVRLILSYAGEDFWMSCPYSSMQMLAKDELPKYFFHRIVSLIAAIT